MIWKDVARIMAYKSLFRFEAHTLCTIGGRLVTVSIQSIFVFLRLWISDRKNPISKLGVKLFYLRRNILARIFAPKRRRNL